MTGPVRGYLALMLLTAQQLTRTSSSVHEGEGQTARHCATQQKYSHPLFSPYPNFVTVFDCQIIVMVKDSCIIKLH